MLAFPPWPMEVPSDGCRASLRWVPPQRFAPYIARPIVLTRSSPPLQVDEEDSSGSSSPDRDICEGDLSACDWRGCNERFASIARLSAHVARVHALPHHDGLFYCSWNGCMRPQRGFNARYKMLVHVRTHTNERPHTCSQCNKSFSRAENLKIHLRSHSGEKPYVCTYEGCGKAYSNSSDRFKHTRTHTVDKPYCCKVTGCNKRYTDPSSLRKHVKTYKHFTPKITTNEPPSDHVYQPNEARDISPLREAHDTYKPFILEPPRVPPTQATSGYNVPISEPSNPIGSPIRYSPLADRVTYINPIDPVMYPLRVPTYEMSYLEYTQMYEHAYRTYYTNSIPLPTPSLYDKVYAYEDRPTYKVEERRFEPINLDKDTDRIEPLNLKRSEPISCRAEAVINKTIEHSMDFQLSNCMDLPLDLSTKS